LRSRYPPLSHRHSFPTRRSSDLAAAIFPSAGRARARYRYRPRGFGKRRPQASSEIPFLLLSLHGAGLIGIDQPALALGGAGSLRSEEHTSELQSRENLVCRLLLE